MRLDKTMGAVAVAALLAALPGVASLAQAAAILLAVAPVVAGVLHRGGPRPAERLAHPAHPAHPTR